MVIFGPLFSFKTGVCRPCQYYAFFDLSIWNPTSATFHIWNATSTKLIKTKIAPPRKKCGHFSSLSFCNRSITKSCALRTHSWFLGLCHCSTSSAMYARFTAGLLNLLLIKCKTLITYISTFPSCLRITFLHSFKTFITHVYSERVGIQTS